ncbi:MAG: hypothetical protein MJY56_03610 [Bacteroidales bacterium]|nr:hypothetical protein [Bacteroidales bacterium]
MGFNFSFFGNTEHRVFNYKPIYYNPEKEALKEKFGHVDGSDKEKYVPGSYIKGSFRDGNYQKTKGEQKIQKFIGMFALILAFAIIILIAKYYPILMEALQNQ